MGIEDEFKKMEKAMQNKREYAIEDDVFLDEVCKDIMQNIPDVSDKQKQKDTIHENKQKDYMLAINKDKIEIGKLKEQETSLRSDLTSKSKEIDDIESKLNKLKLEQESKLEENKKLIKREQQSKTEIENLKKDNIQLDLKYASIQNKNEDKDAVVDKMGVELNETKDINREHKK